MSWIRLPMKYPGKCLVCNERMNVNETALWQKGVGVKHEKCLETESFMKCSICDKPAGCNQCEFREDCNLDKVSELCICKTCSEKDNPFPAYQNSIQKKFRLLETQSSLS